MNIHSVERLQPQPVNRRMLFKATERRESAELGRSHRV